MPAQRCARMVDRQQEGIVANAAWAALSDECEALPEDGFSDLPKSVQKAIARGDMTLDEALERARAGIGAELCPECSCREIATSFTGLCLVCHERRLTEGNLQRLAELEAVRAHNAAKTAVKRTRIELGVPTPRGGSHR